MNYYILLVTSILLRKIWELHFRFPWWLSGKETACNAGVGLTPRWGRSPGEGSGNVFQYPFFFLFIKFYLFIFGCSGSHCCARTFSNCNKWGLLSSFSAWASHCGGLPCCKTWALQGRLSSCGIHRLSGSAALESSQTRSEPVSPALAGRFPTTGPPGKSPHSSILAWKIPWTEEPGGLQTMGLQKSQTTTIYILQVKKKKFLKIRRPTT